mmetsp:Transcript_1663/g.2334  ORF Transcript_1663/g.2334 Transcript_1663/m.2334 type:complete len:226 (+) Transcript_1663:159-836(+)
MSSSRRNDTINSTCEFLEVCFHTILFAREVYPKAVFRAVSKYGVVVRESRHPKLSQYIAEIVMSISKCMLKEIVDKVELVILSNESASKEFIEKFVFEIQLFQELSEEHFQGLGRKFAAFLTRFSSLDVLKSKGGKTFRLRVYTHAHDDVLNEDWICVESKTPTSSALSKESSIGRSIPQTDGDSLNENIEEKKASQKIVPIHHMRFPFYLSLNLLISSSNSKGT